MISRTLVIVLAFGAAAYRAAGGAWIEATGLAALGLGLLILRVWPKYRAVAWAAFVATAASILLVLLRQRM